MYRGQKRTPKNTTTHRKPARVNGRDRSDFKPLGLFKMMPHLSKLLYDSQHAVLYRVQNVFLAAPGLLVHSFPSADMLSNQVDLCCPSSSSIHAVL